ncbi:helix-turn-helix transcriptional regulator [Methanolobus halotolerans]|uniref:Transcriptional regulator n=1 Tax=Methanolobus halotolerans TaxID=2052935 RepID=A0A4E0QQR5_9EURY|nr:winged helix-turn-helix domain-containing protein [Methanolobus halotolerans]TGC08173.1 transcriptional regulator [Methanolobus halotolerans]
MKRPLLDVAFASDKRKSVLLLLQDGPKKMKIVLDSLDTTRQALLPQMRILEDYHLVTGSNDVYKLTTIGEIIVNEMIPLLDTISVFDSDIHYWGTRKLNFIPHYLLERINELGKCRIVNPPIPEIYSIHTQFHETTKISESVFVITTFLYPNYSTLLSDLIENDIQMHIIISNDLYCKIQNHQYPDFEELIDNKLFHLFVCPDKMDFLAFAYNDHQTLLTLLTNREEFDNKFVICSDPSAIEWAKELFEHYLKDSVPITEL